MSRIVSLVPAATEILCALGFEADLVGRSHECDFPESVKGLPICTEAKVRDMGNSGQIDHNVNTLVKQALSIYVVNVEKLKELKPDYIVTQTQCHLCAVSEAEVEKAVRQVLPSRPRVLSIRGQRLGEVWDDFRFIAKTLNVYNKGEELVKSSYRRMAETSTKARTGRKDKPAVACIEWLDPLMAAGNWVPELVHMAGGVNLFSHSGKHSPSLAWEALVKENPDFIVLMPCGFDMARTVKELSVLTQKPEWAALKAVKSRGVYICDGNKFFNRPGPRLVESLEILVEFMHPEDFTLGHQNKAWVPLEMAGSVR